MNGSFVDVVEDVKRLSTEEKQDLKDLLDNYLIEDRRSEILANYELSKNEDLDFSADINKIKDSLDD